MKPTIHLNGTGAVSLTRQYEAAYNDLRVAIASLENCSPNARDYYVQSHYAFEAARAEHVARLRALDVIQQEVADLYLHCQEHVK